MKKYDIAVIPGDGTGPEVVAEARKVLDAVGKLEAGSAGHGAEILAVTHLVEPSSRAFAPVWYEEFSHVGKICLLYTSPSPRD